MSAIQAYDWKDLFKEWFEFALRLLDEPWERLKVFWISARPMRVSLAAVILVGAALLVLDQGRDLLIELAEALGNPLANGFKRLLGFLGGSLALAWACWYWARVAASMESAGGAVAAVAPYRRQLPRLLGLSVYLLFSAASLQVFLGWTEAWPSQTTAVIRLLATVVLIALQILAIRATRSRPSLAGWVLHIALAFMLVMSGQRDWSGLRSLLLWGGLAVLQWLLLRVELPRLRREALLVHGSLAAGYTLSLAVGPAWFLFAALQSGLLLLTWARRARGIPVFWVYPGLAAGLVFLGSVISETPTGTALRLLVLAALSAVLGQLFYWTVLWRRRWWDQLPKTPQLSYRSMWEFDRIRKGTMGLTVMAALITFLVGGLNPPLASWAGPILTVFICASVWVAVLTLVTMVSAGQTFPVLTSLLALAFLFSAVGDNHAVRLHPSDAEESIAARPTVHEAFEAWLKARLQEGGGDRVPCVIVATEGGGSSAAYWTATVLGKVQDEAPLFRERLFAISSVSGGSIGAMAFRALLEERAAEGCVKKLGQSLTGADHLSAQLINGLTVDTLSRFPPFSFLNLPDRAWALERSRETAWRALASKFKAPDRLEAEFLGLWPDNPQKAWPALLLNTTSVENGNRIIVSNLALGGPRTPFDDVQDLLPVIGADFRLSTAADLTTRFPYVSPPATLIDRCGESYGHAVDGGYFENLGATTALEVMRAVQETLRDWQRSGDPMRSDFAKRVVPIALQIASSTTLPAHLGEIGVPADYDSKDLRYGTEALAPPKTLFETRGARGVLATAELRRLAESRAVEGGPPGLYLLMRTYASAVDPPTGRILSETTRRTINGYLKKGSNPANINTLIKALGGDGLSQ